MCSGSYWLDFNSQVVDVFPLKFVFTLQLNSSILPGLELLFYQSLWVHLLHWVSVHWPLGCSHDSVVHWSLVLLSETMGDDLEFEDMVVVFHSFQQGSFLEDLLCLAQACQLLMLCGGFPVPATQSLSLCCPNFIFWNFPLLIILDPSIEGFFSNLYCSVLASRFWFLF